eukprot:120570-Prymnesium_polylepis.1
MVRKECTYPRCRCKEGLVEVTTAQELFCKILLQAQTGWDGFTLKAGAGVFKAKTWLCEEHAPRGLEQAEPLGARVARVVDDELFFGEVTHVAGFSRVSRHVENVVLRQLARPPPEWQYTVSWPGAIERMSAIELMSARKLADAVDAHARARMDEVKAQAKRDVHAALQRGQRAGRSGANEPRTRYVAANYGGLLSAVPDALRRLMPTYEPPAEVVGAFTTETPAGIIHHSGSGLIFDLKASNASTQTPAPRGFTFARMDAEYLIEHPALVHDLYGFRSYEQAEAFFLETWGLELDEPGQACPKVLTAFDEYLLTLWRMRQRQSIDFLSHFAGISAGGASEMCKEWIPRFGRVGRSWVWLPSMEYVERSMPKSFVQSGMGSVALIGDATDILTETVRKMISVRNQQRSDKSKHSAAMGLSWCTPSGWTAIASDLVLGRTSEYNAAVALAPQFAAVPPQWSLCYDKGVASLRAHLPNLNNVIV